MTVPPFITSSNKCSTSLLHYPGCQVGECLVALSGSLPEVKGQAPEGFMEQGAVLGNKRQSILTHGEAFVIVEATASVHMAARTKQAWSHCMWRLKRLDAFVLIVPGKFIG